MAGTDTRNLKHDHQNDHIEVINVHLHDHSIHTFVGILAMLVSLVVVEGMLRVVLLLLSLLGLWTQVALQCFLVRVECLLVAGQGSSIHQFFEAVLAVLIPLQAPARLQARSQNDHIVITDIMVIAINFTHSTPSCPMC